MEFDVEFNDNSVKELERLQKNMTAWEDRVHEATKEAFEYARFKIEMMWRKRIWVMGLNSYNQPMQPNRMGRFVYWTGRLHDSAHIVGNTRTRNPVIEVNVWYEQEIIDKLENGDPLRPWVIPKGDFLSLNAQEIDFISNVLSGQVEVYADRYVFDSWGSASGFSPNMFYTFGVF